MTVLRQFMVFRLNNQRYALPLVSIERIVRAVEVTALPGGLQMVLGVMNIAGRILPVLSLRQLFGLPERQIMPADQFVIASTGQRTVALVIDEAEGVIERSVSEIANSAQIVPGFKQVLGVVKVEDELVLILDPENWLGPDEARAVDDAMAAPVTHAA
ncbi:chemotaxis protein CheW [soil metagenome]